MQDKVVRMLNLDAEGRNDIRREILEIHGYDHIGAPANSDGKNITPYPRWTPENRPYVDVSKGLPHFWWRLWLKP
jgi:hypothetical protein